MNNKAASVVNATVGDLPLEQYFANRLARLEEESIDIEREKIRNNAQKQFNNYTRNVLEACRLELKEQELELEREKLSMSPNRQPNKT